MKNQSCLCREAGFLASRDWSSEGKSTPGFHVSTPSLSPPACNAYLLAARSASEAYAKAGAKEKFVLQIQKNTGHSVNGDSVRAAIDWFVSWLRPSS